MGTGPPGAEASGQAGAQARAQLLHCDSIRRIRAALQLWQRATQPRWRGKWGTVSPEGSSCSMESQAYASVSAGQLGLALRLRQEPTQPRWRGKWGRCPPRLSQSEDARLRRAEPSSPPATGTDASAPLSRYGSVRRTRAGAGNGGGVPRRDLVLDGVLRPTLRPPLGQLGLALLLRQEPTHPRWRGKWGRVPRG